MKVVTPCVVIVTLSVHEGSHFMCHVVSVAFSVHEGIYFSDACKSKVAVSVRYIKV